MALIQCKECGQMISDRAESCPKCGCPVKPKPQAPAPENHFSESFREPKRTSPVIWLLLFLLAIIIGAIVYIIVHQSGSTQTDGNAAAGIPDSVAVSLGNGQDNAPEVTRDLPGQKNLPHVSEYERDEILAVVSEWNNCHNTYQTYNLDDIYADRLFYYTKTMSKDNAIRDKLNAINSFVDKHGYYSQDCHDMTVKRTESKTLRCDFTKTVHFGSKVREYHAYLEMQKFGDEWKITRESDTTTDKNVSKKK